MPTYDPVVKFKLLEFVPVVFLLGELRSQLPLHKPKFCLRHYNNRTGKLGNFQFQPLVQKSILVPGSRGLAPNIEYRKKNRSKKHLFSFSKFVLYVYFCIVHFILLLSGGGARRIHTCNPKKWSTKNTI